MCCCELSVWKEVDCMNCIEKSKVDVVCDTSVCLSVVFV